MPYALPLSWLLSRTVHGCPSYAQGFGPGVFGAAGNRYRSEHALPPTRMNASCICSCMPRQAIPCRTSRRLQASVLHTAKRTPLSGFQVGYLSVGRRLRRWMPIFVYAFPVTGSAALWLTLGACVHASRRRDAVEQWARPRQ